MGKKTKLRVRRGPAGSGRRMGTEIIGKQGYKRADEKKKTRRIVRETVRADQREKDKT